MSRISQACYRLLPAVMCPFCGSMGLNRLNLAFLAELRNILGTHSPPR